MKTLTAGEFWDWFLEHRILMSELYALDGPAMADGLGQLHLLLRNYSGGHLFASINWHAGSGVCRLKISTNGQPKLVPLLEALMECAPRIPGWEVEAFLPARPSHALVRQAFAGTGLNPHDLWFCPVQMNNALICQKPWLMIYSKGVRTPVDGKFKRAVKKLLMNLLGEKVATKDLAGYDVGCCPATGLQPFNLQALPKVLPQLEQFRMEVTERGDLETGMRMD